MTYPNAIDSDASIIRVDDNVTEVGGMAINQIREAIFGMQNEMGVGLRGSLGSLADRLAVAINPNGTIKQSALAAVGLVTLPITNNQVGPNAGIAENKLALAYTTSNLHTLIEAHKALLDNVSEFSETTRGDFEAHLAGAVKLTDGSTSARHVATHIDLNEVGTDPRDTNFTWTGLKDKAGVLRTVPDVGRALLQINTDLVGHENAVADAHQASAINVDVSDFQEIPQTADTVQKLADYLDDSEVLNIGQHRAVQHAPGIPRIARSYNLSDGYQFGFPVIPRTSVRTYLAHPPANAPVDSNTVGDDIVEFLSDNADFIFDAQFSQVRPGDILRINYNNGLETSFMVKDIRFQQGSEWVVRLNGNNLCEVTDGYASARIDRPSYDANTYGVLALAAANSIPSNLYPDLLTSLIAGSPKGACALGLEFDANKINSSYYKLFLQLYPSGNPADLVINLPFIDVTGNAGVTPGAYTLESIVHETNNAFRKIGYNYRFIAFEHEGNFGIMLADSINNASFSIINDTTGTYVGNVIGDFDGLGLGSTKAGLASPVFQSTFADSTAALTPTFIIAPAGARNYIVNGQRRNGFAPTYMANSDGYWPAKISAKVSTGASVEVTYHIDLDLSAAGLQPGKTLVVQPTVPYDSADYVNNDYGRFIIKSANFIGACGDDSAYTTITVINGVHATGSGLSFTSPVNFPVKIFFSEDSIGFNDTNAISAAFAGSNYHRHHEVYIDDRGQTFAHERARLVIQTESSTLLSTARWHVKSVSPKLKGYRNSIDDQNRFLRFYVLSYNNDSGIFDGYVGQPAGTGILKNGPLTSGRKNVTSRFYTESFTDYVDIEFTELSAGPGSTILSTALPRYVDIEIFPSLREQDELLLLGSCEVNWDPEAGQNVVQSVKSLRQFGSIDEMDFTQSAIDFINAGDRALHDNGVIQGFEFDSVVSTTTGELAFSGGQALVNGRIVVSNATTVVIPAIALGGSVPQDVSWAVCVNMDGFLEPIIITTVADQYFATAAQYYVPSVTFAELISKRRDLTPIALVTAHVASITINDSDVADIRRFVAQIDGAQPLVVSGDGFQGNFKSFTALKTWVSKHGVTGSKIHARVRGTIDINASLSLTGLGAALTLEGDNALIRVNVQSGILFDKDITFKNINFEYTLPGGIVYTAGDYVNLSGGCLVASSGVVGKSNVTIEECRFSCTQSGQRPPFISAALVKGEVFDGLRIFNNRFYDAGSAEQAAIAIVGANTGGATTPSLLANAFIENNVGNGKQGIYITSVATTSGTGNSLIRTFATPGLRAAGVYVKNNTMGAIGFVTSGRQLEGVSDGYYGSSALQVTGNNAMYIGISDATGRGSVGNTAGSLVVNFGTGQHIISGNSGAWIHDVVRDEIATGVFSSSIISGNMLSAFSGAYLTNRFLPRQSAAIYVTGLSTDKSNVVISGNTITKRMVGATDVHNYGYGIYVTRSSTISNNVIRGFAEPVASGGPAGIAILSTNTDSYIVNNNSLYRDGVDLTTFGAYIINLNVNSTADVLVTDNYLDSSTIGAGGSSTIRDVFAAEPGGWTIKGNKNHLKTVYLYGTQGRMTADTSGGATVLQNVFGREDTWGGSSITSRFTTDEAMSFTFATADAAAITGAWIIPLTWFMPEGAILQSVEVDVHANSLSPSTKTSTLRLVDRIRTDNTSTITLALSDQTLTLDTGTTTNLANKFYRASTNTAAFIKLELTLGGANGDAIASRMTVTYLDA
jgi:hypothetical protein